MKTTLTILLPLVLILLGYVYNRMLLTLRKVQITDHSNSSDRDKLHGKDGISVGNQFFAKKKNIEIKNSKEAV